MGELGSANVLKRYGIVKDEINQRQAYELFGEAKVKSWRNRNLLGRVKCGGKNSKATYSLIELELLEKLEQKKKIKR